MSQGESSAPSRADAGMTEASYLILLCLAQGPSHGYRVMQVINDVFRTALRMGPGTLYRTLQRLTAEGAIEEVNIPDEEEADGERRRAYRLTEKGRAAAKAEMARLDVLVRLGKAQLAPSGRERPATELVG